MTMISEEIVIDRVLTPEEAIKGFRESKEYTWLKKKASELFYGYGPSTFPTQAPFGMLQSEMIELFNYAYGIQSKARTTDNPNTSPNDEYLLPFASKRSSKLLHHLLTTMVGNISKDKLDVQFTRIDTMGSDAKMSYKGMLQLAQMIKAAGAAHNEAAAAAGLTPDEVPDTMSHLRARLAIDPKLWDERDMSVAVKAIFSYAGMDNVMKAAVLCLAIFAFAGIRSDNTGSFPEIRYMNPIMTRTNWSPMMDYKDLIYFSEIVIIPLTKFKHEAAGWLTDAEIKSVEETAVTYESILQRQGMTGYLGAYGSMFEGDKFVEVMDFEFKHTHYLTMKRKSVRGVPTLFVDLKNGQSPTSEQTPIYARYGGKYCCQTGLMYRCGRLTPEPRQPMPLMEEDSKLTDHTDVILGATFFRTMALNGVSVSPVGRVMEHIDSLNTLLGQHSNTVKAIVPDITTFDLDAMRAVLLSPSQKAGDVKKIVQAFLRRGLAPYNGKKRPPAAGNAWPIANIPNNTAQKLTTLEASIEWEIRQIRMLVGVPETLEGIMPGTRTGDKAMQNMNNQAAESMEMIRSARKDLFKTTAKFWLYTIQCNGYTGSYNGKSVRVNPDMHAWSIYDTDVIVDSTAERWNMLMQAAIAGNQKGLIPFSMLAYLNTESDIQTAELRFSAFEQDALQKQQQQAQQNFQMNAEDQQNKLNATIQGKLEDRNLQTQAIIQKANIDANARIEAVLRQIEGRLSEIPIQKNADSELITQEKDLELRNDLQTKESTNNE